MPLTESYSECDNCGVRRACPVVAPGTLYMAPGSTLVKADGVVKWFHTVNCMETFHKTREVQDWIVLQVEPDPLGEELGLGASLEGKSAMGTQSVPALPESEED